MSDLRVKQTALEYHKLKSKHLAEEKIVLERLIKECRYLQQCGVIVNEYELDDIISVAQIRIAEIKSLLQRYINAISDTTTYIFERKSIVKRKEGKGQTIEQDQQPDEPTQESKKNQENRLQM